MSSAPSETADYQAAVRRLTAENKTLRSELADIRKSHAREIRQLKVQLWEGLAPELTVAKREMRRWRERAQAAEGRLASLRRSA